MASKLIMWRPGQRPESKQDALDVYCLLSRALLDMLWCCCCMMMWWSSYFMLGSSLGRAPFKAERGWRCGMQKHIQAMIVVFARSIRSSRQHRRSYTNQNLPKHASSVHNMVVECGKTQYIYLNVAPSTTLLQNLFHLPLSNEAYAQFQELSVILQNLRLSQANGVWSYIWDSPTFSSSMAYKHLIGHPNVHRVYKWLWKSTCQNKRKFFFCQS